MGHLGNIFAGAYPTEEASAVMLVWEYAVEWLIMAHLHLLSPFRRSACIMTTDSTRCTHVSCKNNADASVCSVYVCEMCIEQLVCSIPMASILGDTTGVYDVSLLLCYRPGQVEEVAANDI